MKRRFGLLRRRPRAAAAQVATATAATAVAAMSLGAFAMGAVAIAALAIRSLAVREARFARLVIDELEIRQARGLPSPLA
jgi:hypothetical protein